MGDFEGNTEVHNSDKFVVQQKSNLLKPPLTMKISSVLGYSRT